MSGLLQPAHLLFILLIVLILFRPDPAKVQRGFRRWQSDLRDQFNALFMAKNVDPGVGPDGGDKFPDEEARQTATWFRVLVAILLGNTLYFLSSPLLPAAARLNGEETSALPALIDIWLCVLVYGILNLIPALNRWRNTKTKTRHNPPPM